MEKRKVIAITSIAVVLAATAVGGYFIKSAETKKEQEIQAEEEKILGTVTDNTVIKDDKTLAEFDLIEEDTEESGTKYKIEANADASDADVATIYDKMYQDQLDEEAGVETKPFYMYIVENCNVRKEPSTNAEILGKLNKKDKVSVKKLTEDGAWYEIDYNGSVGYIKSDLLTYDENGKNEVESQKAANDNSKNEVVSKPETPAPAAPVESSTQSSGVNGFTAEEVAALEELGVQFGPQEFTGEMHEVTYTEEEIRKAQEDFADVTWH